MAFLAECGAERGGAPRVGGREPDLALESVIAELHRNQGLSASELELALSGLQPLDIVFLETRSEPSSVVEEVVLAKDALEQAPLLLLFGQQTQAAGACPLWRPVSEIVDLSSLSVFCEHIAERRGLTVDLRENRGMEQLGEWSQDTFATGGCPTAAFFDGKECFQPGEDAGAPVESSSLRALERYPQLISFALAEPPHALRDQVLDVQRSPAGERLVQQRAYLSERHARSELENSKVGGLGRARSGVLAEILVRPAVLLRGKESLRYTAEKPPRREVYRIGGVGECFIHEARQGASQRLANSPSVVVLTSTVPIGTGQEVVMCCDRRQTIERYAEGHLTEPPVVQEQRRLAFAREIVINRKKSELTFDLVVIDLHGVAHLTRDAGRESEPLHVTIGARQKSAGLIERDVPPFVVHSGENLPCRVGQDQDWPTEIGSLQLDFGRVIVGHPLGGAAERCGNRAALVETWRLLAHCADVPVIHELLFDFEDAQPAPVPSGDEG